jgi:cytochrome c553
MGDQAKRRGIFAESPAIPAATLAASAVSTSAQSVASTFPYPNNQTRRNPMTTLQTAARSLITISVVALLAVMSAHGQGGTTLSANIPFTFEAGSKSLPPGTYRFRVELGQGQVEVSGAEGGGAFMRIITPISGFSVFRDAGLVFNTVEGKHVLAEIWIPGEDGVLLSTTSKQHGHEMVIAVISGPAPDLSGKEIFEHTCARCHGPKGQGNPAADKFFKTPVPRLDSAYVQSKSDEELKDIISHGRRNMDPVRIKQTSVQHLLDPSSVEAVISYVRTLKQP